MLKKGEWEIKSADCFAFLPTVSLPILIIMMSKKYLLADLDIGYETRYH